MFVAFYHYSDNAGCNQYSTISARQSYSVEQYKFLLIKAVFRPLFIIK
jgi:hypothetical protein